MSPGRLQRYRKEQAELRAKRVSGRAVVKKPKRQPPPPPPSLPQPSPQRISLSLSADSTAKVEDVAKLLTREGTSILGSSFGSTGFSSFKPGKLDAQGLDSAMMQGRKDTILPRSTSRAASSMWSAARSVRAVSRNLKRNSFAVVAVGGKRGKGRRGSAAGRLQARRRKFVPLRRVRNPKNVEAVVVGRLRGGSGSKGGSGASSFSAVSGGGHGVYVSPDPEAVRMLSAIARSPLPPRPSKGATPMQRAKSLEKAVRRMVQSLRPKGSRCPKGTRRGFGSRCYSPTMLKLLNRIRAHIKAMKKLDRAQVAIRRIRKGRTLAGSVKRSLAKTYGPVEIRKIAAKKLTLPRGAQLVKVPLRKVKGRTIYKYQLRR